MVKSLVVKEQEQEPEGKWRDGSGGEEESALEAEELQPGGEQDGVTGEWAGFKEGRGEVTTDDGFQGIWRGSEKQHYKLQQQLQK